MGIGFCGCFGEEILIWEIFLGLTFLVRCEWGVEMHRKYFMVFSYFEVSVENDHTTKNSVKSRVFSVFTTPHFYNNSSKSIFS